MTEPQPADRPAPGSPGAWVLASRPKTLAAAIVPVLVAAACAFGLGGFRPLPVAVALAGALLIQIGTNFANDVFDFEKGADSAERVGPTRAVQAGLLSVAQVRRGMVVAFAAAVVCGIYLASVGGWPIVAIGVASIVAGLAYTGGPFPLGYHGLGDVFVLVFFGFVAVCGTVWVQMLALPEIAWWASVPPGCLATAILVVNNVRDRATDAQAGKRTLAVRLGRRAALVEFGLLLAASYLVPLLLFWRGEAAVWILLPLVTVPRATLVTSRLVGGEGVELNRVLESTAQLMVFYGVLFAAGLAAGLGGGR